MLMSIKLITDNKLKYTRACVDSVAGPVDRASNHACPRGHTLILKFELKSMKPCYVMAACRKKRDNAQTANKQGDESRQ